jgi:hypothetical protein
MTVLLGRWHRRQLKARHLAAIANEELPVRDDGMIPGLPAYCLKTAQDALLIWGGLHQHDLPLLGEDEQEVLFGEEEHLAVAIAARPPAVLALAQVDAREEAAVEA